MKTGIYKDKYDIKVYEDGNKFIIEFINGSSITVTDLIDIKFN